MQGADRDGIRDGIPGEFGEQLVHVLDVFSANSLGNEVASSCIRVIGARFLASLAKTTKPQAQRSAMSPGY